MGLSDIIEEFLLQMLADADGVCELRRIDLAERFCCVPSQINYVLSTRFSPEHGYIIESRRGGSGFIRIIQVRPEPQALVMHTVNAVGDTLDARSAGALLQNLVNAGALSLPFARLVAAAQGDAALRPLPGHLRDAARASILKQCLMQSLQTDDDIEDD